MLPRHSRGGSNRMGVFGPHAVQIGSRSIVNMTLVQAAWRAAADLMPIVSKTTAVTTAISAALTAHSTNSLSIIPLLFFGSEPALPGASVLPCSRHWRPPCRSRAPLRTPDKTGRSAAERRAPPGFATFLSNDISRLCRRIHASGNFFVRDAEECCEPMSLSDYACGRQSRGLLPQNRVRSSTPLALLRFPTRQAVDA